MRRCFEQCCGSAGTRSRQVTTPKSRRLVVPIPLNQCPYRDRDVEASDAVDLDELDRLVDRMTERLKRYLSGQVDISEVRVRNTRRETVVTILAQLVHHENEHLSLGVILGAHGIQHPEYSDWVWGREAQRGTQ